MPAGFDYNLLSWSAGTLYIQTLVVIAADEPTNPNSLTIQILNL